MLKYYIPSDPFGWFLAEDETQGKICAEEYTKHLRKVCKQKKIDVDIQISEKLTLPKWDTDEDFEIFKEVSLLFYTTPTVIVKKRFDIYAAQLKEKARLAHLARQKDIAENTIKYVSVPTKKLIPEVKTVKKKKTTRKTTVKKKVNAPMFIPTLIAK